MKLRHFAIALNIFAVIMCGTSAILYAIDHNRKKAIIMSTLAVANVMMLHLNTEEKK